MAEANARQNIWEGSVRSGKTVSSLLRWCMYVARAPYGGELVVTGKTYDTVSRNVFGPLTDPNVVGSEYAKKIHYTRGSSVAHMFGRQIEVITANDASAEARLRGLTGAGAYGDELTLLPLEFYRQLLARLSVQGAKLFGTTNPGAPNHWLRKEYLLKTGLNLRSWHFDIEDNHALPVDYVRDLKAEYGPPSSLWYRRFIKGEWVMAEGAVYDSFDEARHVVDVLPQITKWIGVGIDYGTVNPFAALMLGLGADGRLYFTSEYRYDSRAAGGRRPKTDAEYSKELRAWLATQAENHGANPQWIVVDPSAASFITQLHNDGVNSVLADNSVLDGIRTFASLMATDRVRIHRSCVGLINEIPGYVWSDVHAEKGEDVPVKADDHDLDAARYVLRTTESQWRHILRQPLLELAA